MNGMGLIAIERQRQISQEGWTPEHDDMHHPLGELNRAAYCYRFAMDANEPIPPAEHGFQSWWPWDVGSWKPKSRIRNLVRAGALYIASSEQAFRFGDEVLSRGELAHASDIAKEIDDLIERGSV